MTDYKLSDLIISMVVATENVDILKRYHEMPETIKTMYQEILDTCVNSNSKCSFSFGSRGHLNIIINDDDIDSLMLINQLINLKHDKLHVQIEYVTDKESCVEFRY